MRYKPIRWHLAIASLLIFFLSGCSDTSSPDSGVDCASGPAGFGATQGGVQDMGLARELVASGRVPPAEAFTVEGMFSEHDLPLSGEVSNSILNLRGALGLAPDLAGERAAWIQVGLSSNIDPENFPRPSLSLVACVDVSGSMGWSYAGENTEYPTPGSIARLLLLRIVNQLEDRDRVAIITYGTNVTTLLEPVAAHHPSVGSAIESLHPSGVTNMEAGLNTAFSVALEELGAETDDVRVVLFTDIQPNVGATSSGSFRELAEAAAAKNIGLTVFGLGVGMRQEVMNAISDLRGGNAYSLFQSTDVDDFIEMNWPWFAVPIAHDLSLDLDLPSGLEVEETYGFPGTSDCQLGFTIASVFPSNRKGALLACLKPVIGKSFGGESVTGRLNYTDLAEGNVSQEITWTFPTKQVVEDEPWFDQTAVGKTVALAVLVSGMKNAALLYGDSPAMAAGIMRQAAVRITADAEFLDDEELGVEVQLANHLLALMEDGAPQGDLYGYPGS
jgi:Ca-activated chloride channel homolog